MKRTAILLIMMLVLTIVCGACTSNYSWDDVLKDIDKLKEAKFTVFNDDTEERIEFCTKTLNKQLKDEGYDFTIELKHVTSLSEGVTAIVTFYELATEKQSKQLYDYYMKSETEQKFVRFGKILIHTNSTTAEELLGYDFK